MRIINGARAAYVVNIAQSYETGERPQTDISRLAYVRETKVYTCSRTLSERRELCGSFPRF